MRCFFVLLLLVSSTAWAGPIQYGSLISKRFDARPSGRAGGTTWTVGVSSTSVMKRQNLVEKATPQNPVPAWVTHNTRPLLAVGTILEVNWTSGTLLLGIEREQSKIPSSIAYRARQAGALENLIKREFPARRRFQLTAGTVTYDARLSSIKPPTPASSGMIANDRQRLPRTAFNPGDRVTVLFRIPSRKDVPPTVLNLSRVDPNQTEIRLDYNPTGRRVDQYSGAEARATAREHGIDLDARQPAPDGKK